MTCAGYLTHPSNPSVRMRTCCLHPNGIAYYLIFYFLDIVQNVVNSTTKCNSGGWTSILDRISGITLSLGRFLPSQRVVDSNPGSRCSYWNPVIEGSDSKVELVWATIECACVLSDVRGHPIPFRARQMNSKICKA